MQNRQRGLLINFQLKCIDVFPYINFIRKISIRVDMGQKSSPLKIKAVMTKKMISS